MRLKGSVVLLFVLLVCFQCNYCLGNREGIHDVANLYGIRAYPTYFGALDGEESAMDQKPDRVIMESISHVGVSASSSIMQVNVANFGAKGDGSDATQAFYKAWAKVCSSSAPSVLVVPPNNNYHLKPITFLGPCKSNVSVMIQGMIQASPNPSDWAGTDGSHWILFQNINNLHVGGGGVIIGNGQIWWKNSCKINKSLPCKNAPTAITFYSINGLVVENLKVKNSQQIHMEFEKCSNVRASSLTITAPGDSPNTDGIHITSTKNIHVEHCNIGTGDDCISIVTGSQGVRATNISCGPGHGISIGSLGAQGSTDYVSDVIVDTAQLKGTTNGLRIKSWQGGRGYAKQIRFLNVNMNNVQNPIIIDQNYCDSNKPCTKQKSAVQVSDVLYKNIKGTSASKVAINLGCSTSVPCQGIMFQDIDLVLNTGGTPATQSTCTNARYSTEGIVIPAPCT